MNPVDFARSWTDALTALAVGATTFSVPLVTKIDADGTISVAFGEVSKVFAFSNETTGVSAILVSVLVAAFFIAIGYLVIQIGELLSYLPYYITGRNKIRKRLEFASKNIAVLGVFTNAYSAFRIFCGFGGMMVIWGISLTFSFNENYGLQTPIFGLVIFGSGFFICSFLARLPFAVLDWIIFDKSDF
jgi:hypothetical protein